MKKIYKEEDINIDIETIFNLINDIKSYPNYLPWCTKTEVSEESDNSIIGKIFISKSFINWNFSTKNIIKKNKSISLELVDGPFESLNGTWSFLSTDKFNTKVSLEINYQFKSSIIELSIEPIFTSIMNSILKSFVQEAFKSKYDN
ncbi:MAG: type II toxin-antitoxin system RatA family toxin [Pseudomonadota bacterium]|nr:type II toxin-antitoxin system RatA family toxin [Pseudomonadota bacterium]